MPNSSPKPRAPASSSPSSVGQEEADFLEGTVERITYTSESGFSVVKLASPSFREPVTLVGSLHGVQPGESLRLRGRWVKDQRYGEQFRVVSYVSIQPSTLVGIEKYLGSGLVPGIGPALAERLVARFGVETLDVIESQPERLVEVEGIGSVRSERIQKAFLEQRGIRDVMVFLQSHGVSTGHATRIYRQYRDRAIAVVRDNPYRLAAEVFGIGFKTADELARKLGIEKDSPRRARGGVLHALGEQAELGHVGHRREVVALATAEMLEVSRELVDAAISELAASSELIVEPLITGSGEALYLRHLHAAEIRVAERLSSLVHAEAPPLSLDVERAIAWFEARQGIELAEEQRDAIRRAALRKVVVITGGPGTGKTTIVNGILRILEKKGLRIVLSAPTGRAAKRLSETTGREAKTLHRLLEFSPKLREFQRNEESPIEADLVVVDEASMLDLPLAQHLLAAIPKGAKLLFVGDVDQLPSVGPGSVLLDMIRSSVVDVVRLRRIFRQANESSIVRNAHLVNEGRLPEGAGDPQGDFFFIERDEPEAILATMKTLLAERIPKRFGLDPIDDVQVLTPMHKGLLGAGQLNQELQALLNRAQSFALQRGSRLLRVGDKVMQIRNNYDLDVYNGDIGRIVSIDEEDRSLEARFDQRIVRYETSHLDDLTLAYASSIHKSQGSEYPAVVIPLHTQHYVMLQRNLLYTAITRGKRLVVVLGSRRALEIAVRNVSLDSRFSQLADRLRVSTRA